MTRTRVSGSRQGRSRTRDTHLQQRWSGADRTTSPAHRRQQLVRAVRRRAPGRLAALPAGERQSYRRLPELVAAEAGAPFDESVAAGQSGTALRSLALIVLLAQALRKPGAGSPSVPDRTTTSSEPPTAAPSCSPTRSRRQRVNRLTTPLPPRSSISCPASARLLLSSCRRRPDDPNVDVEGARRDHAG
jgi:hypothetical protein